MTEFEPATLTEALLVVKGTAAPSPFKLARAPRRGKRDTQLSHFPLRLDETRHRRLRLAAAHLRQSGHKLVLAALDHYLDRVVPGQLGRPCPCLEEGRRKPDACVLVPMPAP